MTNTWKQLHSQENIYIEKNKRTPENTTLQQTEKNNTHYLQPITPRTPALTNCANTQRDHKPQAMPTLTNHTNSQTISVKGQASGVLTPLKPGTQTPINSPTSTKAKKRLKRNCSNQKGSYQYPWGINTFLFDIQDLCMCVCMCV